MLASAMLMAAVTLAAPNVGPHPVLSPETPKICPKCAEWNRPHAPVHVFGNTWWVGVEALSVIAIDTGSGIVLLDGGLPQSVPQVKASLASVGLKLSDVKWIGNSHAHFDHAGGIAALQRATGAQVLASPRTAEAMRAGCPTPDDPQAGYGCEENGFAPITAPIQLIRDGEVLKLGNIELGVHLTPSHTPGSTSWTWRSCEGKRCLNMVYADSLTPVADDVFQFAPIAATFKASIAKVEALPCDVLLTPHADASDTLERLSTPGAKAGDPASPGQCAAYAQRARAKLEARLESEKKARTKR